MLNWGMQKDELDAKWKGFRLSKNIRENKVRFLLLLLYYFV